MDFDDLEIKNAKQALEEVTKNGSVIKIVPVEFYTAELVAVCLEHAKTTGTILEVLLENSPKELITQQLIDMCVEAVKKYHHNSKLKTFNGLQEGDISGADLVRLSKNIPAEFWTADVSQICLEEVTRSGYDLRHVPDERITEQMCEAAAAQSPTALQYVPDNFKTQDMCLKAVKERFFDMLKFVPLSCMSPEIEEMINEKLENDTWLCDNFKRIPAHLKTPDICLAAIKKQARAFDYMPKEALTSEIYLEAVKNDTVGFEVGVFKKMPDEFKTPEICLEVIKKTPEAIKNNIPKELITEEICLEAVKKNGYMLEFVPEEFMTTPVCIAAINQTRNAHSYIPEHLWEGELLEAGKAIGLEPKLKVEDINTLEKVQAVLANQVKNMSQEAQDALKEQMRKEVKAEDMDAIGEHKQAVRELVYAIYPQAVQQVILNSYLNSPGSGKLDFWEATRKTLEDMQAARLAGN